MKNTQKTHAQGYFTSGFLRNFMSKHPHFALSALVVVTAVSGVVLWKKDNVEFQVSKIKTKIWNNPQSNKTTIEDVRAQNHSSCSVKNARSDDLTVKKIHAENNSSVDISTGSSSSNQERLRRP